MQDPDVVEGAERKDDGFAQAFEGLSRSLVDVNVDELFPVIDGEYFSKAAEFISQGVAKQPGQMIIVTSGSEDALLAQLRALENPCTSFSIRDVPHEELWPAKVVSVDDFEQPQDVTEDCRPQVMILSAGDRNNVGLNAAIAAVLSKAFDVVEEPIGFGYVSRRPKFSPDMFFFPTCYDMEFRWTPLHLKLSLEGTQMKLERQQQRRKALHKFHQQKRAKRGKEHAKQKQKGMARFR